VKQFRANRAPRRNVMRIVPRAPVPRRLTVRTARRPRAAPIRGRAPSQGTARTEVPLKSTPPRGAPALAGHTPRHCPPVRPWSPFHAHLPRRCRTAALRRRPFVAKVGAAPAIKAAAGHPPARRAPPSAMDNVTTSPFPSHPRPSVAHKPSLDPLGQLLVARLAQSEPLLHRSTARGGLRRRPLASTLAGTPSGPSNPRNRS
jgi:hypothetical protein